MNKSSGTIFHVSPEGVSIKDDTNNKSSGAIYHASPEGIYMDVDGRATHMYRTYGSRVTQGAVTEEQLPR